MSMNCLSALVLFSFLVHSVPGHSEEAPPSPYFGRQHRTLQSLSDEDVRALRSGEGMGLAKPAELNGYPGPAHVLELKSSLSLTPSQVASITKIHDAMRRRAIALGEEYLAAESDLERAFAERAISRTELRALTGRAAELHARLREVHLVAHLDTLPILTFHQVAQYQGLRGYSEHSHRHDTSKHPSVD